MTKKTGNLLATFSALAALLLVSGCSDDSEGDPGADSAIKKDGPAVTKDASNLPDGYHLYDCPTPGVACNAHDPRDRFLIVLATRCPSAKTTLACSICPAAAKPDATDANTTTCSRASVIILVIYNASSCCPVTTNLYTTDASAFARHRMSPSLIILANCTASSNWPIADSPDTTSTSASNRSFASVIFPTKARHSSNSDKSPPSRFCSPHR